MAAAEEEEWDFDDPRFLTLASTTTTTSSSSSDLTYAEKRRRTIGRGRDKMMIDQRSQKQKEDESREEGLRTNLIARDTMEGESKALRMMKGMGFKPGEGLGKKRPASTEPEVGEDASSVASSGGGGGLGFKRAATTTTTTASSGTATPTTEGASTPATESYKPRTEPIQFEMREKRTGLGIPQPKRTRPFPSSLLPSSSSTSSLPTEALSTYITSIKSSIDDRRAYGYLRSLRRTCEELDRRNGVEESVMWRDREEEEKEGRRRERNRIYERGDLGGLDGLEEVEDVGRGRGKRGGELGYEMGISGTVVDVEGEEESGEEKERKDEEEEWFAYDLRTRLGLTLSYLRRTYHYCFWCGCAYNDSKDLETNCPGEDEAAHE